MYRFVTLAAFLVLLNPLAMSAEVTGNPSIQLVPENARFAPGETGKVTFSIINNGQVDSPGPRSLEQQVLTAQGFTYSVGEDGNASAEVRRDIFAVGTVPDGMFPEKLGFPISIHENASAGLYEVPVNVSYEFKDRIEYTTSSGSPVVSDYFYEDRFREKGLMIRVSETANLRLVGSSFSGSVGDSGILTLKVRNVGGDSVSDTSFSLQSMNPDLSFGRSAKAEKFVGEWGVNETRQLEFRTRVSRNALKSEMTVKASASFRDDGYPDRDSFTFGVDVAGENKLELRDVDAELRKGSEDSISGTVVNLAGRELSDVELVFRPQDPYLSVGQASYPVGDLGDGESANFSFPVEVSSGAEAGPRLYGLNAVYRSADGDSSSRTSLDFDAEVTDSEGDFVVEAVNSSVSPGGSTVLDVRVSNPSGNDYGNVDAKIFTSSPISSGDDRAFRSSLDAGESKIFSFKVSASGSALEKSYPVRMDFRYEVDGDSKMSETYRTAVSVEESEGSSSGFPVLPVLLLVVLVALVGGSYYAGRPEAVWER